jgi:hypothetical protein
VSREKYLYPDTALFQISIAPLGTHASSAKLDMARRLPSAQLSLRLRIAVILAGTLRKTEWGYRIGEGCA